MLPVFFAYTNDSIYTNNGISRIIMVDNGGHAALRLPAQDLQSLSVCDASPRAFGEWVDSLPMANLGETTRNLYKAISELNRLQLSATDKLALLEIIRPKIYFACNALSRHYLKQPLLLPPQPRKVAQLCQALETQLSEAYIGTALSALSQIRRLTLGKGKILALASTAIHRGISDLTQTILRTYQLYKPVDKGTWQRINYLYLLAEKHEILDQSVNDPEFKSHSPNSLSAVYTRAMLLACIKHNQLRQSDISTVYNFIDSWCHMAHIRIGKPGSEQMFIVDLEADAPVTYRSLFTGTFSEHCRNLETQQLVDQLKELKDTNRVPDEISGNLLNHLILAWGVLTKRTFMRVESNDHIALCIGLTASHFFCSGEREFEEIANDNDHEILVQEETNPFLKEAKAETAQDIWDAAYTSTGNVNSRIALDDINYEIEKNEQKFKAPDNREHHDERYNHHDVSLVDVSPGGYCLKWLSKIPTKVQAGELLGLKEKHHNAWSLGVIRWVKAESDETRLGIELLSPTASPYGARVLQKTGDMEQGNYLRALMLPEIKLVGQAATLITPAMPFKERQKVRLVQGEKRTTVQLTKRLFNSVSFSQFEFKILAEEKTQPSQAAKGVDDNSIETNKEDGFDSLWNNL